MANILSYCLKEPTISFKKIQPRASFCRLPTREFDCCQPCICSHCHSKRTISQSLAQQHCCGTGRRKGIGALVHALHLVSCHSCVRPAVSPTRAYDGDLHQTLHSSPVLSSQHTNPASWLLLCKVQSRQIMMWPS